MLRTLIEKEWKSVLLSPKFALTFAVTAGLILLSLAVGLREIRTFQAQQAAGRQLLAQEHQEQTGWMGLTSRVFREADPVQIFVAGVHNDVGRLARISPRLEARLDQSIYSDDTILAMFRAFDLSLVVEAVLSLFAILFTYDAINGERAAGTLKLIFSSAVPRARYVLAKFLGTWLGLAVPLALPVLLGLLAAVLARVPFDTGHWMRLGLFLFASAIYFTFFVAFGVAVSALTRRPATSFLVLLVSWVLLVLVVPRAGLIVASEMVRVPTVAEVESQKVGFESRAWNDHRRRLEELWDRREAELAALPEAEREAYEDANLWRWLEQDDQERKALEVEIAERSAKLEEARRHLRAEQQRLAFTLSRLSPASTYRLVAMRLAGTGVSLKTRYEDAARAYKQSFLDYVEQASDGGGSGHVLRRRGGGSGSLTGATEALDLSGMPSFQTPRLGLAQVASAVSWDFALLAVEVLLCFAVGFVGFLRYDVR